MSLPRPRGDADLSLAAQALPEAGRNPLGEHEGWRAAKSPAVTPAVCAALWAHFDERCGTADVLPRGEAEELMTRLQLSRSQVARHWDRWRIARRDTSKAHEHSASLHAHRRRAFGADDTLFNRLRTIAHDADFVKRVQLRFPQLPLIANLRCGAWYAPPEAFAATVRFKSTGEPGASEDDCPSAHCSPGWRSWARAACYVLPWCARE
jgi:hypothetical protein